MAPSWRQSAGKKRRHTASRQSTGQLMRQPLNAKTMSKTISGKLQVMSRLPNMQDNIVVQGLLTAEIGSLEVDKHADLLSKTGAADEAEIVALRVSLIQIYYSAAYARERATASQSQIKAARQALAAIVKAYEQLELVKPEKQRGFQGLFGPPHDDRRGTDELNRFGSRCFEIRMKLIPLARELETEFDAEISKPVERGERKKRLQTLTNALAAWWQVGLGRRLKIEVRYQRRKHGLTVLGWSGEFLNVARALFVQLDGFYDSEVVSACKNEVEDRAGQRIRKWPPPGFESFELRCIVPPDSTA